LRCFRCGTTGHVAADCKSSELTCYKCGKTRHRSFECKSKEVVCYNYREVGHISTKCLKHKNDRSSGALNAAEGAELDNLIRGFCLSNNTHLLAIIDTGATHPFIFLGCAKRLNLVMFPMLRGMVINTSTNGSVTTSLVCLNCSLNFGDVDFKMNFICLPLEHMDVIFGMNWLLSFGVNINCLTKSITFSKLENHSLETLSKVDID
jgi:hypothetical protein